MMIIGIIRTLAKYYNFSSLINEPIEEEFTLVHILVKKQLYKVALFCIEELGF